MLALVVALVIQFGREQGPVPVAASPTPSVIPTASATTAAPSPSASQTSSPSVEPSQSPRFPPGPATEIPASGIKVTNKLPPSGRWAIVVRRSYTYVAQAPTGQIVRSLPTVDSLAAVSLDASAPRTVDLLSYLSAADGVPLPSNLLRSQFSPDGHRLVLSVIASSDAELHAGLVIVDLVAGTVTRLAAGPDERHNDVMPAWRPNGEQIAFVRSTSGGTTGNDARIIVIGSDGAAFREVLGASANGTEATRIFSWNADGTGIGYSRGFESSPYYVLNLSTGRSVAVGDANMVPTARGADTWRIGQPAFAGAFAEGPNGPVRSIAVADAQLGGPTRNIVTLPLTGVTNIHDPRWRPGTDDILYVQTDNEPSSLSRVVLTNASGAVPRIAFAVDSFWLLAAWTADGRQIAYARGNGVGMDVHVMNADGSGDRAYGSVQGSVVPEAPTEWPDFVVLSL